MSSRDQSLRPDTWNLSGTHGNVFGNPRAGNRFITDTLSRNSSLLESECYRWEPCAREYRETCREKWRTIQRHNSIAEFCKKTINHEFFLSTRRTTEFYGWSAKIANLGASFQKFPHTFNAFMLEDKIRNPNKCLFRLSLGGNVKDQRSGDGRFGGRFEIISLDSG